MFNIACKTLTKCNGHAWVSRIHVVLLEIADLVLLHEIYCNGRYIQFSTLKVLESLIPKVGLVNLT